MLQASVDNVILTSLLFETRLTITDIISGVVEARRAGWLVGGFTG